LIQSFCHCSERGRRRRRKVPTKKAIEKAAAKAADKKAAEDAMTKAVVGAPGPYVKEDAAGSAVTFESAPEESLHVPQIAEPKEAEAETAAVAVVQYMEVEDALCKLGVIEVKWRSKRYKRNCFVSKCKKGFGLLQGCRYCELCVRNAEALAWHYEEWETMRWDEDLELPDLEVCKEGCEKPCEACNFIVLNCVDGFYAEFGNEEEEVAASSAVTSEPALEESLPQIVELKEEKSIVVAVVQLDAVEQKAKELRPQQSTKEQTTKFYLNGKKVTTKVLTKEEAAAKTAETKDAQEYYEESRKRRKIEKAVNKKLARQTKKARKAADKKAAEDAMTKRAL